MTFYLPSRYHDLVTNLVYWLESDDSFDNIRYSFLNYLVNISTDKVNIPIDKVNIPIDTDKVKVPVDTDIDYFCCIYLENFSLSFHFLQFCIDSCLFISSKSRLVYFLNKLGCRVYVQSRPSNNNGCREVLCKDLPTHLNFHDRVKFYSFLDDQAQFVDLSKDIDNFLLYSSFRNHCLLLLSSKYSFVNKS